MKLSELHKGTIAKIVGIEKGCAREVHQRFLDLGFVPGAEIAVHNISPLKDPVAYTIHNTLISLRREDANMVLVSIE
ncbi:MULTISPECIES: ferrous iron transport protein A [Myroides]|uniref:Ferrous iron transport protein A n=1 Tax=Myroides albus TaxID=2562892 RepID=A0A6I3LM62_9FLAO|nr:MULTISPECIES: FeoA family protein [Myroides]MTG98954.1 ferrous iron transport protein A [Myroides albus]MVX34356.1 ferrous iron transport protein A [Myroides sp. LoEW2-1]UVD78578.1 ferrous iron transport protein A [Myroides albus]